MSLSVGDDFGGGMTLELYRKICNCLIFLASGACKRNKVGKRDDGFNEERMFYSKNKRNLFLKKSPLFPIYQLDKDENDQIVLLEPGVPKLLINMYDRKTCDFKEKKEVVYEERVPSILKDMHNIELDDGSLSCHPGGINALSKQFQEKFYYRGTYKAVTSYLNSCQSCKLNKPLPMTAPAPPIPIRSHRPHERLQYDLVDLAHSKHRAFMQNNQWKFRYILSVKCCFSKFCWWFPLRSKHAKHVAVALNFICEKEGYPEILQSDNGSEFIAEVIKLICQKNDITIKHGKPRHPQSQGQVENLNKRIKAHLARLLYKKSQEEQASSWPSLLPGIANVINNTWHATIQDIPFRVYRGREPISSNQFVIPDDGEFLTMSGNTSSDQEIDSLFGDEDENDGDDESGDDDDDGLEADLNAVASPGNLTMASLYQSCASKWKFLVQI